MAKNFRVSKRQRNKSAMDIKLSGDFDASSAYELLNVLSANSGKAVTIAIDTSGLKSVSPFGLDLFRPLMSTLRRKRLDIQVTGRFRGVFCEA